MCFFNLYIAPTPPSINPGINHKYFLFPYYFNNLAVANPIEPKIVVEKNGTVHSSATLFIVLMESIDLEVRFD